MPRQETEETRDGRMIGHNKVSEEGTDCEMGAPERLRVSKPGDKARLAYLAM